ncbi:MAG: nucleoside triphosphate pyrophosphohydrolase [Oscillospiraceae bacterium]
MVDFNFKENYNINDLIEIMKILRSENGCLWDREQNHKSIRKNLIEETYEVIEAIDNEDTILLKEELGDVLLQVVFHSQMEEEHDEFNFNDVCNDVCEKLITRHPHIFSNVKVESTNDILSNWEKIKQKTKNQKSFFQTLESVPKSLPGLMRSQKVCHRAQKAIKIIGNEHSLDNKIINENINYSFSQLKNLINCLEEKINTNSEQTEYSDEIGEILFSLTNLSNIMKIDCEEVIYKKIDEFISNFTKWEEKILLN